MRRLVLVALVACAGANRPPAMCTEEALFTAALLKCIESSGTREESRKCRKTAHDICGFTDPITPKETP